MRLITIRFVIGAAILLLVDILWVASSELTEYLYHEKKFNKPFFTAYCKSVMFMVYMLGFCFCDSWWSSQKSFSLNRLPDYYSSISDTDQQNLTMDEDEEDEEEDSSDRESSPDGTEFHDININQPTVSVNCNIDDIEPVKDTTVATPSSRSPFIGNSIWLPIKHCSDTSSLSGRSETDDDENVSADGEIIIKDLSANSRPNESSQSDNHKMLLIGSSNVNFKKKSKRNKRKSKKIEESSLEETLGNDKNNKPKRNVRFSKLIEVRTLTDKHAEDAYVSRLSYSAFMRHLYSKTQQSLTSSSNHDPLNFNSSSNADFVYRGPKMNVKETALLAFYFTPIWFAANLSFHVGLQYSEAGLVNVLSSTTPLFTLLLSIIFPSGSSTDAISLTKLLGVLVFISSVAIISTSEPINHTHQQQSNTDSSTIKLHLISNDTVMPLGSIWSLVGAFFYSIYIVLMRYNVVHDAMLNFPMFFGFIGVYSLILMWPIILLLNFTQLEIFDWPTREQWLLILVNGLCGTVISELLWLLGSFMTSSLVGTVAVSFTIPLAVFFDVFYKNVEYPRLFFLGTIPMFFSFIIIIFVSQYDNWDPILSTLEKCVRYIGMKSNESAGYRSANGDLVNESSTSEHSMAMRVSHTTESSSTSATLQVAGSDSKVAGDATNRSQQQGVLPSTRSTANNRRFDGKSFRPLKKADSLIVSSSSISSRHMSDEDQEQSQSLIEAEDNAYA